MSLIPIVISESHPMTFLNLHLKCHQNLKYATNLDKGISKLEMLNRKHYANYELATHLSL